MQSGASTYFKISTGTVTAFLHKNYNILRWYVLRHFPHVEFVICTKYEFFKRKSSVINVSKAERHLVIFL